MAANELKVPDLRLNIPASPVPRRPDPTGQRIFIAVLAVLMAALLIAVFYMVTHRKQVQTYLNFREGCEVSGC